VFQRVKWEKYVEVDLIVHAIILRQTQQKKASDLGAAVLVWTEEYML
jgi:hypothetical protein